MNNDPRTAGLSALVDALNDACNMTFHGVVRGELLREGTHRDFLTSYDPVKLYDRLAEHFAAEQSGNGFEMLFEMREALTEAERQATDMFSRLEEEREINHAHMMARLDGNDSQLVHLDRVHRERARKLQDRVRELEAELRARTINLDFANMEVGDLKTENEALKARIAELEREKDVAINGMLSASMTANIDPNTVVMKGGAS